MNSEAQNRQGITTMWAEMNDFPRSEGSQVRILPRAQNQQVRPGSGEPYTGRRNRKVHKWATFAKNPRTANPLTSPYRHANRRTGKARNPFRNGPRVLLSLIVFPVLAVFAALLLAWFGPNRYAVFGFYPEHGAHSAANWCAEWSMVQVSAELQAYADEYRTTAEFAQLCGS
jgi:hypothetical protein